MENGKAEREGSSRIGVEGKGSRQRCCQDAKVHIKNWSKIISKHK